MNKDHIEGAARQAKGAVKDAAGKLTDNPKLRAEGNIDKAAGKAQSTYADAKDKVRDAANEAERKAKENHDILLKKFLINLLQPIIYRTDIDVV